MNNTNRRRRNTKPMTAAEAAALLAGVDIYQINFHPNRVKLAEAVRVGVDFAHPERRAIGGSFVSPYMLIPGKGYWCFNQQIGWIPVNPEGSRALRAALAAEAA